ncbi:hypothetical protein HW555_010505 [Spodoptera exigua]|uniref:Uncharacterized protein n=1 Tax=Spodoptera exigua TaxID=7107 RepID=A0A835L0V0_SPOEX|nr:hypothetical protein HW555_010505 [Spodoptera exigua]
MSRFVAEVPEVLVKPGKMISLSSSKMKVLLVAVIIVMYVYLLIYFKTIYLKTKRLDEIMAVGTLNTFQVCDIEVPTKQQKTNIIRFKWKAVSRSISIYHAIVKLALKTERELLDVDALDKKLAMQMARVDQLYDDY